ncbi:sulfur carrier protein ThiS [Gordonia westfalica]|uniref:Sulfur carrier protein n=1 Tax=Gordonia westfalica TaxID=158898 RepID=A0A1H2L187_9ACTN|nr:sulfur carrier protein ThiS [Gordonia westfalica]MDS1114194.1 sulfur carrier protein ThiS [Gordonia westfalica]SDU74689.1 sulfur carrier protein [Gordonia westfalica]
MTITVNGENLDIGDDVSVRDVVARLGLPDRGIAVAVDGAVVPRGRWSEHTMAAGAVVEIVTAVQGG